METILLPKAATAVVIRCTQAAQSHPAHQVLLVFTAHAPKNIIIYIMYHKLLFIPMRIRILVMVTKS
jgi:hypothetical protein